MAPNLEDIAASFGLAYSNAAQAKNAVLSKVFTIDEKYILRSRTLKEDTSEKFEKEQRLLETVKPLVSLEFPELLANKNGQKYLIQDSFFWTAYPIIPGDVICSWWNLELLDEKHRENLYVTLRNIHAKTTGTLSSIPYEHAFLKEIRDWHGKLSDKRISPELHAYVGTKIEKVSQFENSLQEKDLCYIHGDYHPGNIVFRDAAVVGLIDIDWSRKGHAFEDLSYTIMTLQRRYQTPEFVFDESTYESALAWYGLPDDARPIFEAYMVLSVFYDLYLFCTLAELQGQTAELRDKPQIIPFQFQFLENLRERFA